MSRPFQRLRVKRGTEKRLKSGHLWIYSNEVASSLKTFHAGEWIEVESSDGHGIGVGYVNPGSLIAVRLVSSGLGMPDEAFFADRIRIALSRRSELLANVSVCRVVFGESDGLPGLVIDRYGAHVVIQILTAGMETKLDWIVAAVDSVLKPDSVILRNDASSRKLEGLPLESKVIRGSAHASVTIEDIRYELDLLEGQKTGFFLDQRWNHLIVRHHAKGKRVLDVFSYVGAWSMQAGLADAESVVGIDISPKAIDQSRRHADINHLGMCVFRQGDAFDELKGINDRRELFDVIILDPPAFAKSRSEAGDAIRGYREINRRASKALVDGGLLITNSCSHVIDPESFRNTVLQGISSAGCHGWLIEQRSQAPDHPVLMSMRETEYLKCLVVRVFR